MFVGRVALLAASVGGATAAPRLPHAGADFTLSNGVVSATISPTGLTELKELVSPGTGVRPLALRLEHDDWAATLRPGGAPDRMRRFLVTTKPANDTTLSSESCTPDASRRGKTHRDPGMELRTDAHGGGRAHAQARVHSPRRCASAVALRRFFVTSMTPWTPQRRCGWRDPARKLAQVPERVQRQT